MRLRKFLLFSLLWSISGAFSYIFLFSDIGYFETEKKRKYLEFLRKENAELTRENQLLQEKILRTPVKNEEIHLYLVKIEHETTQEEKRQSGDRNKDTDLSPPPKETLFFRGFVFVFATGFGVILYFFFLRGSSRTAT